MISSRIWNQRPWPPRCSVCGKKMTRPGALVFSPPWEDSHRCSKAHLCTRCYDDVQKFMSDRCTEHRAKPRKRKKRKKTP